MFAPQPLLLGLALPRYFLDFECGDRVSRDPEGLDFPDLLQAQRDGFRALAELVLDRALKGDEQMHVVLVVRAQDAEVLFRAELDLKAAEAFPDGDEDRQD